MTGGTFTYDGQPHPATVSIIGVNGEPLGPVLITYNGSTTAPVNPGTYTVAVTFYGNANYNAASAQTTIVILQQSGHSVRGHGYRKNHPDAWPVASLTLGVFTYNQAKLLVLLPAPTQGDARVIPVRQLIAAKLNVAAGDDTTPIQAAIGQATPCWPAWGPRSR